MVDTEQRIVKVLLTLGKMDYNKRMVVTSRMGLARNGNPPLSLTEIGRILRIGRHKVREIEKQALRELAEVFESDN